MASMASVLNTCRDPRYYYIMLVGDENKFKCYGGNALEIKRVTQLGDNAPVIKAINALGDYGYRVAFSTPKHDSNDVTYLLEKRNS